MDDGHIFSFATIALGLILMFVFLIGGIIIHLFFAKMHADQKKADQDHTDE